jgi:tRNA nucleotidyltransferase/poly(A) polymerase
MAPKTAMAAGTGGSSPRPSPDRPPFLTQLRPELAARVEAVVRLAADRGVAVYLVGGTVRDLLLGRDSPDLDLVAVGDGLGLAAAVARELGGRLVRHDEFLTADVVDAAEIHLDIATARQESYAAVAALPEVRPAAALAEDLLRRDFTVNAMALRLARAGDGPPGAGNAASGAGDAAPGAGALPADAALIDPFGGQRDLAARALSVLHDRSFLDDPTRVFRGVRFEVRLGFRLTAPSEELARQAVAAGAFARLSGSRLRHELELLLEVEGGAPAALAGLDRLQELGALATLHPRLVLDDAGRRRLRAAAVEHDASLAAVAAGAAGADGRGSPRGTGTARSGHGQRPQARRWMVLLLALAAGLASDEQRAELADRLLLAGDDRHLLSGLGRRLAAALPRLAPGAQPHEVDAALAGLAEEELVLLAATGGAVATGETGVRRQASGSAMPLGAVSARHAGSAAAAVREWVRRYLLELRPLALGIRGSDLLAAGARPGPEVGRALRATREARLDGTIGAGEELGFALAQLARRGAAPAAPGQETARRPFRQRGEAGPQRGKPGLAHGKAGPQRGKDSPERGKPGPERGAASPRRGKPGSESGKAPPKRGGKPG